MTRLCCDAHISKVDLSKASTTHTRLQIAKITGIAHTPFYAVFTGVCTIDLLCWRGSGLVGHKSVCLSNTFLIPTHYAKRRARIVHPNNWF